MNSRIKELRKALGLSQEEFGVRLGVSNTAISKIEKGERNITDQMLLSIVREYKVNKLWLRTGEGNMFDELTPSEDLARYCAGLTMGKDKYVSAAILAYSKLSEENKQVIDDYISELAKKIVEIDSKKDV